MSMSILLQLNCKINSLYQFLEANVHEYQFFETNIHELFMNVLCDLLQMYATRKIDSQYFYTFHAAISTFS